MKTLYLLRHAKSDWDNPLISDYDRPLNHRGQNDVPLLGSILSKKNIVIDLALCSSANRTRQTLSLLQNQVRINEIRYIDELYLASAKTILQTIKTTEETYKNVLVIGHNPGITDCFNLLSVSKVDNMPTCAFASFEIKGVYNVIVPKSNTLTFFWYPKI